MGVRKGARQLKFADKLHIRSGQAKQSQLLDEYLGVSLEVVELLALLWQVI